MLYCSVNYQPVTNISSQDRGLAYGDGIFTTGKVVNGELELKTQHLKRLQQACIDLKLIAPNFVKLDENIKMVAKNYSLAVLKVIITAGVGGRGYSRAGIEKPTIIISVFDFPAHYTYWQNNGAKIGICKLQLGLNPMLAGIKSLNRLEQVLIRKELDERVEDDLLVTDINKNIVETSCANIFFKINGVWQTPRISMAGIAGLKRAQILSKIDNILIVEMKLTNLLNIEAMFMCNSVMGVVPITEYNKQDLSISMVDDFRILANLS